MLCISASMDSWAFTWRRFAKFSRNNLDFVAIFFKAPVFRRMPYSVGGVGHYCDKKARSFCCFLDLCQFLGSIVQQCMDRQAHPNLFAVLQSLPARCKHVHMRPFIPKYTYANLITSPFISSCAVCVSSCLHVGV